MTYIIHIEKFRLRYDSTLGNFYYNYYTGPLFYSAFRKITTPYKHWYQGDITSWQLISIGCGETGAGAGAPCV